MQIYIIIATSKYPITQPRWEPETETVNRKGLQAKSLEASPPLR
jgi:hypothetical protein